MISKPLNKQLDHYLLVNELVSNSDLIKVILPFKQQRTKILKKTCAQTSSCSSPYNSSHLHETATLRILYRETNQVKIIQLNLTPGLGSDLSDSALAQCGQCSGFHPQHGPKSSHHILLSDEEDALGLTDRIGQVQEKHYPVLLVMYYFFLCKV